MFGLLGLNWFLYLDKWLDVHVNSFILKQAFKPTFTMSIEIYEIQFVMCLLH